jgi:hypothetical protein
MLRSRLLYLLAASAWGHSVVAQESTGTSGGPSSGTGTGGRSPSSLLSDSPFTGTPAPSTDPGASPSFRTGAASTLPEGAPTTTEPSGAATSFDAGQSEPTAPTRAAPTSFSIPGLYGRGPQEFVAGQGRLARPRFRFTVGGSVGFDDNVFQTPTNARGVPDQEVQVLVSPATPDTTQEVTIPSGDPLVPDRTTTVVVPGKKAKFRTERIPGIPAPERTSSLITQAQTELNVQMATRRDLFTFDFQGSAGYYWDRPGDQTDYTGRLALIYLRKLTARAQFTANIDASYQSQPDFAQINSPTNNTGGEYLQVNAKGDLSYRLTPRFSTVTSVAYNAVHFMEKAQEASNYGETTFGTELRYLFSPRLTLLGEVRYSSSMHQLDEERDTTTYFGLVGGELRLSRRFVATLRIGEALQTFDESGEKSSSPYLEGTLSYLLARGTALQWNVRYGYEESGSADSELIVARTGLSLTQIFSPRFQGSLALNLLHSVNTTESDVTTGGPTTTIGPDGVPVTIDEPLRTETVTTEDVQDTIDATLSFQYVLSRKWSFNLSYTYTMVFGPDELNDYYRQRVFLGAEYLF